MSERTITSEQVREEHLKQVNEPLHWVYLATILLGALILMVVLIAVLGAGTS